MSSPLPGLNWTCSAGQTGLDTTAAKAAALARVVPPPRMSAAAAARRDETIPFISPPLRTAYLRDKLGIARSVLSARAAGGAANTPADFMLRKVSSARKMDVGRHAL